MAGRRDVEAIRGGGRGGGMSWRGSACAVGGAER